MKTVKELRLKIEDLEKRICSTSNTKLRPELAELVAEITALNCSLNFDDKNITELLNDYADLKVIFLKLDLCKRENKNIQIKEVFNLLLLLIDFIQSKY